VLLFKETIAVPSEYHMNHKDALWAKYRVCRFKEGGIGILSLVLLSMTNNKGFWIG
jgi:hypothetical protein